LIPFVVVMSFDRRHDIRVTITAGALRNLATAVGDLNWVRIISHREVIRMPKPVSPLRPVFADKIVRSVAVVAGGNISMTALSPAIELFLHDVAIGAGLRVVRQIRCALRVDERERHRTRGQTEYDAQYQTRYR